MIALDIAVPFASWVKPAARQYRETEVVPPPSTCYGFLLSLVGETDPRRHVGARVAPGLIPNPRGGYPEKTRQLRLLHRIKVKNHSHPSNFIPDLQEIYADVRLALWLSSRDETARPTLEDRVNHALDSPHEIHRFGGLSMGESNWLVNSCDRLDWRRAPLVNAFQVGDRGRLALSTWVTYATNHGTTYAVGDLHTIREDPPDDRLALIPGPHPQTLDSTKPVPHPRTSRRAKPEKP